MDVTDDTFEENSVSPRHAKRKHPTALSDSEDDMVVKIASKMKLTFFKLLFCTFNSKYDC